MRDYGDPTDLNTATTQGGIVAYVVSPRVNAQLSSSQAELVVAAYTEGDPVPLRVSVTVEEGSGELATASGDPGPGQRFTAPIALLHGLNDIRIRIASADGTRTRLFDYRLAYQGDQPGLRITALAPTTPEPCKEPAPIVLGITSARTVCVRGHVTTKDGPAKKVRGRLGDQDVVSNDEGAFEAPILLRENVRTTLEASVLDAASRTTVVQDSTPPTLTIDGSGGIVTDDELLTLKGTAGDDNGLASLQIENGHPIDVAPSWSTSVHLANGPNPLVVVARDLAGNEARASLIATRNRLVVLNAAKGNQGGSTLSLDRAALGGLFTAADQQAITLVDVPLKPTILATLEAIRDPVAAGIDTTKWGAAEWNLYRLINVTPDNASLRGTSMEKLVEVAAAIGIPPPRIVASLVDIDVVDTFVQPSVLADVLLERLVGTHPNAVRANGEVVLRVSLYDAMQNLTTLSARFGPAGGHPGFLSGPVFAKVFEPGFLMSLPIKSNLTQYEGVNGATRGKDYLFRLHGSQILDLDFESTDFSVVGLVDEPTADLTFSLKETPTFYKAGNSQTAGADPDRPGFRRGNSAVLAAQRWFTEGIIQEVAYRQYFDRFGPSYAATLRYDAGSITNAAVINWSRGWTTIQTSGGIGDPPPPVFFWDLLMEVAQVRLHDGGIAEGAANAQFRVEKLAIGLTADQLIERVKPKLKEQEVELSKRIVGTQGLASSSCDVYFVPPLLYFRAASDGFEGAYPYTKPGMFSDAALTNKLSSIVEGHETVAVTGPGQAFFFQDQSGGVHEFLVKAASANSVTVRVSEAAPR